jgi:predicted DsbA family dithiol-disulfide isomerase
MIIDAVYDFLCPWCFVGKRHLDLAIAQERPLNLRVRYRPSSGALPALHALPALRSRRA